MAAAMLCAVPPDGFCDDPSWRVEFDEACAGTANVMALPQTDLQALIAKCERLQKTIEQLDESTRKVFLKRLHMCKKLYQYVLDANDRTAGREAQ
jgi:hypothetical protein